MRKIGKAVLMIVFFLFIIICGGGNKPYVATSVCREISFEKTERRTAEAREIGLREVTDQNILERIDKIVKSEIF